MFCFRKQVFSRRIFNILIILLNFFERLRKGIVIKYRCYSLAACLSTKQNAIRNHFLTNPEKILNLVLTKEATWSSRTMVYPFSKRMPSFCAVQLSGNKFLSSVPGWLNNFWGAWHGLTSVWPCICSDHHPFATHTAFTACLALRSHLEFGLCLKWWAQCMRLVLGLTCQFCTFRSFRLLNQFLSSSTTLEG